MAKTKKGKQFFNIGGVFFLLIVIPLSLMAFLIANGMFKLGVTIKQSSSICYRPKISGRYKS